MIDHPQLSMAALDLVDPTAPVSEGILLSSSVDEIELEDPASGDYVGELAESNAADAAATIKRARAQADDGRWAQMPADERQSLLDRLADVMEAKADALAEIGTLESGTPTSFSRAIHAEAPLDLLRKAQASDTDSGLDLAVIGFHQPLFFAMKTVAASLARGRASVVVPSTVAPLSTVALMNCLLEADLPKGVVSSVLGTSDVLAALGEVGEVNTYIDYSPNALSSGSTALLQMPGSDIESALRSALLSFQVSPGWRPGNAHLLVSVDELDDYRAVAVDVVDSLLVGDPWDDATSVGPVPGGTATANHYVTTLTTAGASAIQGSSTEDADRFFAPTVITDLAGPNDAMNSTICAAITCVVGYSDAATAEQWMASLYPPAHH